MYFVVLPGRSCLVLAVQQGSIPAIKLLVEGGCDLNRYEYGIHETALHHAVRKGRKNYNFVKKLFFKIYFQELKIIIIFCALKKSIFSVH